MFEVSASSFFMLRNYQLGDKKKTIQPVITPCHLSVSLFLSKWKKKTANSSTPELHIKTKVVVTVNPSQAAYRMTKMEQISDFKTYFQK